MMAIGQMQDGRLRPFRSTGKGGGSDKGKPQSKWPMVAKVAADAVYLRVKGSMDAWIIDRRYILSELAFEVQMEQLFPGFWAKMTEFQSGRKTPLPRLLSNRVFKMYYNGTSARGPGHDPNTRASISREHWSNNVPQDHPLRKLHRQICGSKQTVVLDWEKYL